jgi:hypothetical protein
MPAMTKARRPFVSSDDLPEAYLRRLLGDRLDRDAAVFSRSDALREAARHRKPDPKRNHPLGRTRRGRADR